MKNHRDIVHSLCEALLDGRNDVAQRMIYSNDIANEVDADRYALSPLLKELSESNKLFYDL